MGAGVILCGLEMIRGVRDAESYSDHEGRFHGGGNARGRDAQQ